jgi:anti-anti-sigma factor
MIDFREADAKLLCTFSGRLDTLVCQELDPLLAAEVESRKLPVVFDLTGVDYVASAFLRLCIRTARQTGGVRFSIVNLSPQVMMVFKMAGFDKLFPIASV